MDLVVIRRKLMDLVVIKRKATKTVKQSIIVNIRLALFLLEILHFFSILLSFPLSFGT